MDSPISLLLALMMLAWKWLSVAATVSLLPAAIAASLALTPLFDLRRVSPRQAARASTTVAGKTDRPRPRRRHTSKATKVNANDNDSDHHHHPLDWSPPPPLAPHSAPVSPMLRPTPRRPGSVSRDSVLSASSDPAGSRVPTPRLRRPTALSFPALDDPLSSSSQSRHHRGHHNHHHHRHHDDNPRARPQSWHPSATTVISGPPPPAALLGPPVPHHHHHHHDHHHFHDHHQRPSSVISSPASWTPTSSATPSIVSTTASSPVAPDFPGMVMDRVVMQLRDAQAHLRSLMAHGHGGGGSPLAWWSPRFVLVEPVLRARRAMYIAKDLLAVPPPSSLPPIPVAAAPELGPPPRNPAWRHSDHHDGRQSRRSSSSVLSTSSSSSSSIPWSRGGGNAVPAGELTPIRSRRHRPLSISSMASVSYSDNTAALAAEGHIDDGPDETVIMVLVSTAEAQRIKVISARARARARAIAAASSTAALAGSLSPTYTSFSHRDDAEEPLSPRMPSATDALATILDIAYPPSQSLDDFDDSETHPFPGDAEDDDDDENDENRGPRSPLTASVVATMAAGRDEVVLVLKRYASSVEERLRANPPSCDEAMAVIMFLLVQTCMLAEIGVSLSEGFCLDHLLVKDADVPLAMDNLVLSGFQNMAVMRDAPSTVDAASAAAAARPLPLSTQLVLTSIAHRVAHLYRTAALAAVTAPSSRVGGGRQRLASVVQWAGGLSHIPSEAVDDDMALPMNLDPPTDFATLRSLYLAIARNDEV
ncbi:hypothetical protein BC828DRAFT_435836 [Blastocladiella britannica]|nr:hypothetical protein BC828DRAFT_435836 [Blastocladiella britannica]